MSVPGAVDRATGIIGGIAQFPYIHGFSWYDKLASYGLPFVPWKWCQLCRFERTLATRARKCCLCCHWYWYWRGLDSMVGCNRVSTIWVGNLGICSCPSLLRHWEIGRLLASNRRLVRSVQASTDSQDQWKENSSSCGYRRWNLPSSYWTNELNRPRGCSISNISLIRMWLVWGAPSAKILTLSVASARSDCLLCQSLWRIFGVPRDLACTYQGE